MVGDPYQLPPVGAGAPLRDLVEYVPMGMLTKTHRNAGTVAKTAAAIRSGEDWTADPGFDLERGRNHVHIECFNESQQFGELKKQIDLLSEDEDVDPIWDIQILGIINKKSELSVSKLNEVLQERFNPGESRPGCIFRVKDKVINTSNGWLLPAFKFCNENDISQPIADEAIANASGQVFVANGEIGEVMSIEPKHMTVRMRDPVRFVMVPLVGVEDGSEEGQTGSNFQLGYAITTHKAQGSQFPYVIAMIDDSGGARRLADRSLWYTMITRTSKACVTIGKKSVIVQASRRSAIDKRKTFLKERLREMI